MRCPKCGEEMLKIQDQDSYTCLMDDIQIIRVQTL